MSTPLVTVCVSYYNDEKYLAQCIESILAQSFSNFELILFNHASTDGSYKIAHSYNDSRIIHIDAPKNLGAGASYNFRYVLPKSKGEYYKGFCADDVMDKDCLKVLLDYANKHPNKDIIFGNLNYINANGSLLKGDWFHHFKGFSVNATEIDLLKMYSRVENNLPVPGALIKMEILKNIKFDESMTIYADMWLWLSALINGAKIGFVDKIVGFYRRHQYQESYFNGEIIGRRAEYETVPFLSLFFELKDVDVVKTIFDDSPYRDKMQSADDIPFYVAEYFLRKYGYTFAYEKLFHMLQDDKTRTHLEQMYGFGVLELRKLYAFGQSYRSLKEKIYHKKVKRLTILDLMYLLSRKILNNLISLLTLRFYRRKI